MLKYLVLITRELLATSVLIGMLYAYITEAFGRRGRNILTIGVVAGLVSGAIMSWFKNNTGKIDTSLWNLYIFICAIVILVIFYVTSALHKKFSWAALAAQISAALFACAMLFYEMPDVYAYPTQFSLSGESVFSTNFLYRFIGYLAGLALDLLAGLAIFKAVRALQNSHRRLAALLTMVALGVLGLQFAAKSLQTMLTRRIIASNHTLFTISKYTSNYSDWFIYAILIAAALVPLMTWLFSFKPRGEFENPARRRKDKAVWRTRRRWATLTLICFAFGVFTLTVLNALDTRVIELSPTEAVEVHDDNVYISLESVADGHLHRFGYNTPNNVEIRIIVIKKPNSSAYGVGLDACDICGETGYYERDGQVVCKLCDVVMNINTIGFKGGCNPIVIDYSVADGNIIIPVDALMQHEKTFK